MHTKEEVTVCVKELDLFVTGKLLDDTPAVLSLGILCQDHGYSCEWTSGHKPQLIEDGRRKKRNTPNYVPIVVLGLSTSSSSYTCMTNISIAGSRASRINSTVWRNPSHEPAECEKTSKNGDNENVRRNPLRDLSARMVRRIYRESSVCKCSSS